MTGTAAPHGAGFHVRPDELRAAGDSARRTAELLPPAARPLLEAADRAENALAGWATAAGLGGCADSWRALLGALGAELDRQGGNLLATAANYRDCDTAAAAAARPAAGR
ncbi:hypothetical protein [Kitasatospora sp. NPDC057223]|uniref:hypothetical protein n=1 Tax=Kitasatospora sp. NPDC057223 TaxID=3346055 RepID=UPI003627568F